MYVRLRELGFVIAVFGLIAPASAMARETVSFDGYSAGTIVVKTKERRLYYMLGDGRAVKYPVGSVAPAAPGPARASSAANT